MLNVKQQKIKTIKKYKVIKSFVVGKRRQLQKNYFRYNVIYATK